MKRINIASKVKIIGLTDSLNIVMLGAGNVATHISRHLHSIGHSISCIYSKTKESAAKLAHGLATKGTNDPQEVPTSADFYIICVPDQAIEEVVHQFQDRNGIWLHTAGAVSIEVFKSVQSHYGVLYPLQTFSKTHTVSLLDTPLLIEGSDPETTREIGDLAHSISSNVHEMDSFSRMVTHLAAVFANNFTNHMVRLSQQILEEHNIDRTLMDVILKETYRRAAELGAHNTQTGPAMRGDEVTMQKHRALLKQHPEWEKWYTFISRDIDRSRSH